ncbi:MAG: hypothetical protein AABW81_00365 [Nanoarchaeota archaeon]
MSKKLRVPYEKYVKMIFSEQYKEAKIILDEFYSNVFEVYKQTTNLNEKKLMATTLAKTQKLISNLEIMIHNPKSDRGVN